MAPSVLHFSAFISNETCTSLAKLPTLMYTICCFAALMRKHHRIILNYYLKYMSGFDAQMLRNVVMVSVSIVR